MRARSICEIRLAKLGLTDKKAARMAEFLLERRYGYIQTQHLKTDNKTDLIVSQPAIDDEVNRLFKRGGVGVD